MAEIIIIRNLDEEINENLELIKKGCLIGSNSKAAVFAINEYNRLLDKTISLEKELIALDEKHRELIDTILTYADAKHDFYEAIKLYQI